MWTECVIDVTHDDGEMLCFCPIERGPDGGIESIVTGMNYLSLEPPADWKIAGVVHADGQDAVEAWCETNAGRLTALSEGQMAEPCDCGDCLECDARARLHDDIA